MRKTETNTMQQQLSITPMLQIGNDIRNNKKTAKCKMKSYNNNNNNKNNNAIYIIVLLELLHRMAAQSLTKLHVVTLLTVYIITRAAPDSKLVNVTCSQHCHCYKDTNHRISAKCDLSRLNSSYLANISMPQDLFSL